MRRAPILRRFSTILSLAAVMWMPSARAADEPAAGLSAPSEASRATCPMAAHNAYPYRLYGKERLTRALAAGMRFIEIDVTYDASRGAVVVTHDSLPRGNEPTLAETLEPLWAAWSKGHGPDYTLIIDFKVGEPEIAQGVQAVLQSRAELLSTMRKARPYQFKPGKITVCLTGTAAGHRAFDELVPEGGTYLAFADVGYGATDWKAAISEYVPADPPGFQRFITLHGQNCMSAADARGTAEVSVERMRELMLWAGSAGWRVRIYTINPPKNPEGNRDFTFWERAADAGMHMIATDDYELAQEWWASRESKP